MKKRSLGKLGKNWNVIAVVVVLGVAATLVGWRVYADRQVRSVSNFYECQKASGSVFLDSYPEVCMTKYKKSFPNPDQQAPTLPPIDKATNIRIHEWNVGISVPGQGAYYTMNPDGTAYITTTELERLRSQIQGCKSGLRGITVDRNLKEVGVIETMCMPEDSPAAQTIRTIQQDIRNALKSPATL